MCLSFIFVMQLKRASVENEKAIAVTVRQMATLCWKCEVRSRSSPSCAVAALMRQGEKGRACLAGRAKERWIPLSVSLALRDADGAANPASSWKWFTAAAISFTNEVERRSAAYAERMRS